MKIKQLFQVLGLVIFTVLISSCSKEEESTVCPPRQDTVPDSTNLRIAFKAMANGMDHNFDNPYTDPLNRTIRTDFLKYYVSNVYLLQGSAKTLVSDVALIELANNGEDLPEGSTVIKAKLPAGNYDGLALVVGLDEATNATDPVTYPDDHPLALSRNTHWGPWTKYKFIMIEGKSDLDGDGMITDIHGYHTGFDTCYREKTFTQPIVITDGERTKLDLSVNLNDIFFGSDTLDIAVEPSWHGDTSTVRRALIISDNFIEALTLN